MTDLSARFAVVMMVVVIAAAGRVAHGDDGYPTELTDRPVIRPARRRRR